jgi:hypothetical protein
MAQQIAEKSSTDVVRYAIMAGLKPAIAAHIKAIACRDDEKKPLTDLTIEELLKLARSAELMPTADSSVVDKLAAQIQLLSDKLDMSIVRQVRTPTPERRQVTFADRQQRSLSPRQTQWSSHRDQSRRDYSGSVSSNERCSRCNLHHGRNANGSVAGICGAWGKRCRSCNALNHYARCCFSRKGNAQ